LKSRLLDGLVDNGGSIGGLNVSSLRNNGGLSGNDSLGSSGGDNLSLGGLDEQSKDESQGDQSKEEDGAVPGRVSSPLVSKSSGEASKSSSGGDQRDSSSEKSHVLVSKGERAKGDGGNDAVDARVPSKGISSVAHVAHHLSLVVVIDIVSRSSVSSGAQDLLVSVKSARSVDSIGVDHADGKDDDGSQDESHGQKSRDDHHGSSTLHGSSVLVASEVDEVDEVQPGEGSSQHEDQGGSVDPLEGRVVLVDGVSSDAGSINEAVGHGEQSGVLIQTGIGVVIGVVGGIDSVVLGVPPRSAHGGNVKESGDVGQS